jgi:hypothetical protein
MSIIHALLVGTTLCRLRESTPRDCKAPSRMTGIQRILRVPSKSMITSCQRPEFCRNVIPVKLTAEPNIDCTNLEMGATATACVEDRPRFDLPVSLDESALGGILSPLAFPYVLCQQRRVVLAACMQLFPLLGLFRVGDKSLNLQCGATATASPFQWMNQHLTRQSVHWHLWPFRTCCASEASWSWTRIRSPLHQLCPQSPNEAPITGGNQKCGLFQLGILCFRKCGL